MDKMLSPADIAARLACSRSQARELMATMQLVDIGAGAQRKVLRVWESDLEKWLMERSRPARTSKPKGKRTARQAVPHVQYRRDEP